MNGTHAYRPERRRSLRVLLVSEDAVRMVQRPREAAANDECRDARGHHAANLDRTHKQASACPHMRSAHIQGLRKSTRRHAGTAVDLRLLGDSGLCSGLQVRAKVHGGCGVNVCLGEVDHACAEEVRVRGLRDE